jgi:hypothetical protein
MLSEIRRLTTTDVVVISKYCAEEVARQYFPRNPPTELVAGMIYAWMDAIEVYNVNEKITPDDIKRWGAYIEPHNNGEGYRKVPIFVGDFEKMNWRLIDRALEILVEAINLRQVDCLAAYREFEEIHPFIDGNGRTGKIILNYVNNTLLQPTFPPNDFWGREIVNP